jgi:hypothetical protein
MGYRVLLDPLGVGTVLMVSAKQSLLSPGEAELLWLQSVPSIKMSLITDRFIP